VSLSIDPIWSYPKPLQQPHPPILLGTLSTQGLQRVVRYCNGWIPGLLPPKELAEAMRMLRGLAEQAGRSSRDVPVSIFGVPGEEETLRQYQELGVERAVLAAPSEGRDQVLPLLDRYAAFLPKFA
jgi:alkanesulfonate monooxygenase SsuD/methylene tetrahydromethanopterin reductase-like flavin-dependent oxidoreductase (luciferase family)